MYTHINFNSKKALKDAVTAYLQGAEFKDAAPMTLGAVLGAQRGIPGVKPVTYYQPNDLFGTTKDSAHSYTGTVAIEGPHYPEPHRWYATCTVKDGVIVKVK